MEQEQNMTNTQVDVPVSAPEQNNVMDNSGEKKKGGNGMLIGLVLCVIAAVAGIGFGVWVMMDGNTQKDNYEKQISSLRNQINELQEKTSEDAADKGEYIYVGEWGIKIKIPGDLSITGYNYRTSRESFWGKTAGELAIWGFKGDDSQDVPAFADSSKNAESIGTVMRFVKGAELRPESTPSLLYSDDEYDYYYKRLNVPYSIDESEQNWESESNDLIYQMISNKDNYSEF